MQQFESFHVQLGGKNAHPGSIAAGPVPSMSSVMPTIGIFALACWAAFMPGSPKAMIRLAPEATETEDEPSCNARK